MKKIEEETKEFPIIELRGVGKSLGGVQILHEINLSCYKGRIYGITGYNGSGKTVLLKCICGLYRPDEGSIYRWGELSDGKILTEAGMIIESPAFLSERTGFQNLELLYMLNHKRDKRHIEEIMNSVGLDPFSRKKVKNYSLGMRQRLAIGQALMEDPEILVLDEPMNGLDRKGSAEIREMLQRCKERGKTIFLASHSREDIDLLCDEVYEIESGRIIKIR